ncbi:unnamed protein product [Linum tenue]|uniref:Uncharacterized protein n=1 Tax=Linum tenue TaxID=586396 RepID=A0AAV0S344_9ROSI|nr:unnamed protein product [Linum tenue]
MNGLLCFATITDEIKSKPKPRRSRILEGIFGLILFFISWTNNIVR